MPNQNPNPHQDRPNSQRPNPNPHQQRPAGQERPSSAQEPRRNNDEQRR